LTLQNVTVRHNRAVGGDGNSAGTVVNAGIGGGIATNGSNNNAPQSSSNITTIQNCTVAHNLAIGGRGGDAMGGGVANVLGGVVIVSGSTLSHNCALGGDGGHGFGGAIYNGAASDHPSNPGAPTVLHVEQSVITHNKAQDRTAGVGDGDGIGGGVYDLGFLDVDVFTLIDKNKATTSHDDLFDLDV
jgi:hypothetical protein